MFPIIAIMYLTGHFSDFHHPIHSDTHTKKRVMCNIISGVKSQGDKKGVNVPILKYEDINWVNLQCF